MSRLRAMLLVGPTGSGKTPLGDHLASCGLWGRRCRHFDFGAHLRRLAEGGDPTGHPGASRRAGIIRQVLARGALLENETFYIARALLESFLAQGPPDADALVVLNGLPRHADQARDVERIVRVQDVVELVCSPQTVLRRIEANVAGDRAGRPDDSPAAVERRLGTYLARTVPLLDHYRDAGTRILRVDVSSDTTCQDVREVLESQSSG